MNATNTIQTVANGRTFTLTAQNTNAILSADLKARGFDGMVYMGVSLPVGRQRTTQHGMFYRCGDSFQLVAIS